MANVLLNLLGALERNDATNLQQLLTTAPHLATTPFANRDSALHVALRFGIVSRRVILVRRAVCGEIG